VVITPSWGEHVLGKKGSWGHFDFDFLRGVMSCALSSSRNLSSPTLECKETPYFTSGVEKGKWIGKKHGN
jgi:hypothetical protein